MQSACATLSFLAHLGVQYLLTLSHKQHDFRKKKNVTEHKMCVLIFSTALFSERFVHSKKHSARYYHKCQYVQWRRLLLSGLIKLEFSRQIF